MRSRLVRNGDGSRQRICFVTGRIRCSVCQRVSTGSIHIQIVCPKCDHSHLTIFSILRCRARILIILTQRVGHVFITQQSDHRRRCVCIDHSHQPRNRGRGISCCVLCGVGQCIATGNGCVHSSRGGYGNFSVDGIGRTDPGFGEGGSQIDRHIRIAYQSNDRWIIVHYLNVHGSGHRIRLIALAIRGGVGQGVSACCAGINFSDHHNIHSTILSVFRGGTRIGKSASLSNGHVGIPQ